MAVSRMRGIEVVTAQRERGTGDPSEGPGGGDGARQVEATGIGGAQNGGQDVQLDGAGRIHRSRCVLGLQQRAVGGEQTPCDPAVNGRGSGGQSHGLTLRPFRRPARSHPHSRHSRQLVPSRRPAPNHTSAPADRSYRRPVGRQSAIFV